MLDHDQRVASARAAVDYITGRSPAEQQQPIPNCPGWTVYNAAAHIGRVAIAWAEMISSSPDDPESRERGYAQSAERPTGAPVTDLAAWANSTIDRLEGDTDRRCYFSMTGGEGTVGLWAWHAASELGVHRLDVESALGDTHAITDDQAIDAVRYTCEYFLPAMRRATGKDPGPVTIRLRRADGPEGLATIESDSANTATIEGAPVQALLALWGRPHRGVDLVEGDAAVWAGWQALPGEAFQFGTWD